MNYNKILQGILDIGESMQKSGAETFRLEDSLYRICKVTVLSDMMCSQPQATFKSR